jgi:hypothetical protein
LALHSALTICVCMQQLAPEAYIMTKTCRTTSDCPNGQPCNNLITVPGVGTIKPYTMGTCNGEPTEGQVVGATTCNIIGKYSEFMLFSSNFILELGL